MEIRFKEKSETGRGCLPILALKSSNHLLFLRERETVFLKHQNVRDTLIARTVAVIANEGLDKTTTKAIVAGTGINEAYIYRHFSDKEDLLAKTFEQLDSELISCVLQNLSVMQLTELDYDLRCRVYFTAVWKFMLGNREHCLAYVRYYYSPYFTKYSADNHATRYKPFIEKIRHVFKEEADVWMILNHVLNVMLDFAVKVHNNQMPKEDDYAEHVFRVIYVSVKQYFKDSEERNTQI